MNPEKSEKCPQVADCGCGRDYNKLRDEVAQLRKTNREMAQLLLYYDNILSLDTLAKKEPIPQNTDICRLLARKMTFWEALCKLTPEQRAASEAVIIGTAKMNELIAARRLSQGLAV